MSTLNDMTDPASAVGSTSRGADGVAASRSTVDIELVCVKGERNNNRGRNSWASGEVMDSKGESSRSQNCITGRRRQSPETEWRVKWAQRGIGTFGFVGVLCHIVGWSIRNNTFQILAIVWFGIGFMCVMVLLYKNISFVIMKRLLKEPNVIIIMVLSLCNWTIDIGRPLDSSSAVDGFIYMLLVNSFVLTDAVIIKSRYKIIGFGILFVALTVYNIYSNTLGDSNNGVVLVQYSIDGKPYTIMKRSTKRSIYLQVILFSANGIYTTFVDKTMKLMMFATGNIYKSTGTASEEVEAGSFAYNLKQENHKKIEEYRQSRRGVIKK